MDSSSKPCWWLVRSLAGYLTWDPNLLRAPRLADPCPLPSLPSSNQWRHNFTSEKGCMYRPTQSIPIRYPGIRVYGVWADPVACGETIAFFYFDLVHVTCPGSLSFFPLGEKAKGVHT